jgi:hypothetical protein
MYKILITDKRGGTIIEDFDGLWELVKQIALGIDRRVLGIEDADEGQYD